MIDIDEIALETVKAIGNIDPDKLPGGATQAIAQAQILVRDAIESQLSTAQAENEALRVRVAELAQGGDRLCHELECWMATEHDRESQEAMAQWKRLRQQAERAGGEHG